MGKGIRILRFKDGVTREHATYNGEMIKQSDVNLLGYPLYFVGDAESQKKTNVTLWKIKLWQKTVKKPQRK